MNPYPFFQFKQILFFQLLLFVFTQSVKAQPIISSFSPAAGPIGSQVIINGVNFSSTPQNNIVYFGAARAAVSAASSSSLTVTVPLGATYQPITVTVNKLTGYSAKQFSVTFNAPSTVPAYPFSSGTSTTTDLHPNSIVMMDFDGDGKPDVATANDYINGSDPASVSILRNTSGSQIISFAPKMDIATGAVTSAVASADLDGDGKADLVSVSVADKTMSIHKNTSTTGTISFAAKQDYATGTNPIGIAIADLDGDGKPDIAVVNSLSNTVSIFKNTSNGTTLSFEARPDIATGVLPQSLALSDVDGDGKPDLTVVNYGSKTFSVYLNNSLSGTILFATKTDTPTSKDYPYGLVIGDLDGDDKKDIVISNWNYTTNTLADNGFLIFRNTGSIGNAGFSKINIKVTAGNGYNPSLGDINGDGKPEIILPNYILSASTLICPNYSTPGNIVFDRGQSMYSVSPYAAAVGDLDGDGLPDIASANFTSDNITVFRNVINAPYIYAVVPSTAAAGTTVTITGYGFSGATNVSFGGVSATSFSIISDTKIAAAVGAGASGSVTVTNASGTGTLDGFEFAGPPVIQSFTPAIAGEGMTVKIKGQNFNNATSVKFGGIDCAIYNVISPFEISAVVGKGASGSVSVSTKYGTGTNAGFTWVVIPAISSFTPTSAGKDSTVTISGLHFADVKVVDFNGVAASSFSIIGDTVIKAVVGNGSSGNVNLTDAYGTVSKAGFTFVPAPTINTFTPTVATAGSAITITGKNFIGVSSVLIGGISASTYSVVSSDTIIASVDGNVSGDITVFATGGKASLAGFVNLPAPLVLSFAPQSGSVGSTVNISGSGFSSIANNNTVYFGAVQAKVTAATANNLTVTVPSSADYNAITVTNNNLVGVSTSSPFITSFPAIDSFTSTSFVYSGNFKGGAGATDIVSADMDGDGKPDIVTPNFYDKKVDILRNKGAYGTVALDTPISYPVSWIPNSLKIADLDGDGKPELLAGCYYDISIFLNTSSPGLVSFADRVDVGVSKGTPIIQEITVNDYDGDGRQDIAVLLNPGTPLKGTMYILRNTGTKGKLSFTFSGPYTLEMDSWAICSGDFDGDGKTDIAAVNRISNTISMFRNISTVSQIAFQPLPSIATYTNPNRIVTGDLDGDGKTDLLVLNNSYVSIYKNNGSKGNISFAPRTDMYTMNIPTDIKICDVSGDGIADIIVKGYDGVLPSVAAIFKNKSTPGTISFGTKTDIVTIDDGIGGNDIEELADINGDSQLDLLVPQNTFVAVYTNMVGSKISAACPGTTVSDSADKKGNTYQWQLNMGNGFSNLTNSTNYSGVNTAILQISNVPLTWNNYHYRCLVDNNPGLSNILSIVQLSQPNIAVNNKVLTVSNPDTTAKYTWQIKAVDGSWSDITPLVTETNYTIKETGTFRVKAGKDSCITYSAEQAISVTAIPVVPAIILGIHAYPNPAPEQLIVDSLRYQDHWQTLEIIGTDGKQQSKPINIQNQTSVTVVTGYLPRGIYVAVLKRSKGAPAIIKFVK
ncbi:MAG: FG-GAP-like repeat-containing protein [Chitinophagaceae bacterium]